VKDHFGTGIDAQVAKSVKEAIRVFETLGAKTVEVELPHSQFAIATYYIISSSEASGNLARYDGAHYGYRTDERIMMDELAAEHKAAATTAAVEMIESPLVRMYRKSRSEGFGLEVKRRIMLGTYALSAGYYDAYYLKALQVRRLIRQDYDAAFKQVDCLIGPCTPTAAFKAGEKIDDPLSMYLGDLYTVGANLSGLPGISLPCGFTSSEMPIGLQLQGQPFAEQKLLEIAAAFQVETDWHARRPNLR
jgi:aspartyl-tRNA(Asn)/glutamyl-tRNA(Gln) amidotransferase subunit A